MVDVVVLTSLVQLIEYAEQHPCQIERNVVMVVDFNPREYGEVVLSACVTVNILICKQR